MALLYVFSIVLLTGDSQITQLSVKVFRLLIGMKLENGVSTNQKSKFLKKVWYSYKVNCIIHCFKITHPSYVLHIILEVDFNDTIALFLNSIVY